MNLSRFGYVPPTGSFNTVGTYTIQVQLQAGANTIRFAAHAGTYAPDPDQLAIAPVSDSGP